MRNPSVSNNPCRQLHSSNSSSETCPPNRFSRSLLPSITQPQPLASKHAHSQAHHYVSRVAPLHAESARQHSPGNAGRRTAIPAIGQGRQVCVEPLPTAGLKTRHKMAKRQRHAGGGLVRPTPNTVRTCGATGTACFPVRPPALDPAPAAAAHPVGCPRKLPPAGQLQGRSRPLVHRSSSAVGRPRQLGELAGWHSMVTQVMASCTCKAASRW